MSLFDTAKNVGPCEIFRGDDSPLSLGLSFGGITVTEDETIFESKADATGETSRSEHVTGQNAMAVGAITEASAAQAAMIFGVTETGSTTQEAMVVNRVGTDLMDSVERFSLRPIVGGVVSTTEADWIEIPAGTIKPKLSLDINTGAQKAWGFEIKAHFVSAAHIDTGGHLYNSGSPEFAVNDLIRFGKATSV